MGGDGGAHVPEVIPADMGVALAHPRIDLGSPRV
jgi:hypothetical protein